MLVLQARVQARVQARALVLARERVLVVEEEEDEEEGVAQEAALECVREVREEVLVSELAVSS